MTEGFIQLSKLIFQFLLICLSVGMFYVLLNTNFTSTYATKPVTIQVRQKVNQTKLNAFIITPNCRSERFNATKENLEQAFPNLFNILCFLIIPLNDSRVHTSNVPLWKKFSTNLVAFIELWTYEIPKRSQHELEWSFVFEDDVNFHKPEKILQLNYIEPLKEMMSNLEVQINDGFFYLGICGPEYPQNETLKSKVTNNTLISQRGYGYCLHATAITAKRSQLFWTEISSYRPNAQDRSLDYQIREYCIRSKKYFYILGSNLHFLGVRHFGIAFQDRGRFPSMVPYGNKL